MRRVTLPLPAKKEKTQAQTFAFAMLLITSRLSFSYSLILSSSSPTTWKKTVIAVLSLPLVPPLATFRTPLSLPLVPPYRYLSYPPLVVARQNYYPTSNMVAEEVASE